ncbi:hypothetical protein KX928_23365 [Roseobacter sp. YSTF-M11]|uniref:Uncharacterized protein n=1 Tax=Roseobacter insulae TaxID=2859783 RepID=A0A9X1G137_9RHOB|nr:hypothetical protein [Roseobacter insulae]MBW4710740.1 hypothetical protein [Roseobacter insulae]
MANIHDCLQRAMDAGEVDTTRGKATQERYDQLVARYEQVMPRHQAEAAAGLDVKEALSAALPSRQHKVIAQLQTMRRMQALITAAPDPAVAIRNLIEFSDGSGFTGESVRSLSEALVRTIDGNLQEFLRANGLNVVGSQKNKALLADVIDELHGTATGNQRAGDLAAAVRSEQQRLRRLFNAHGGDIGELADYGAAHTHDVARLRKAGPRAWKDAVRDRIDWTRIKDFQTGKPFAKSPTDLPDPVRVDAFLDDVYQGIVTRGWDSRDPTMSVGGKALYNQRAEHRVLHFKSGRDWMAYNRDFGRSDPFTALIGGLHGMARDVAQMRVLGPNPRMGLEFATQVATKQAVLRGQFDLEGRIQAQGRLAKTMLSHFDGSANVPENAAWASFFGGTRKVLTSTKLGSALLSAVTDKATMHMAAKAVGMNPYNVLTTSTKLMASAATRRTAAQMGYIADTLADMGSTAARFTGETFAPEITERLSGATLRLSGLSFWTDMNKTAFQMEFAGFMAENADRALADIDPLLRQVLERRGISAADWDQLRNPATMFRADNGATFMSPLHWLNHQSAMPAAEAEGLALRLQMAIEEQLEFAVPTASLEGRARLQGSAAPGTFAGELLRSTTMFKSFALSLTLGQIRRVAALPTLKDKLTYSAQMAAGLFILGGVAVQLKEIAKGRDPRPMNTGAYAMAAMFQGGGLGIFGDFFAAETNRFGGGLASTLAGPVAGFASDVINPVASNLTSLVEGRDTALGRDVANFVRYNTPVLSSLWYQRVAFDRAVADQLQLLLDPEAEANWRRQERQRDRTYGNTAWWQRGEITPERAPDLSNAFEGAP